MITYEVWAIDSKSEVRSDLRGRLEAVVASEATTASKTASEVRSDLRFGIYGPNFIWYHIGLDSLGLFWPFFGTLLEEEEEEN